MWSRRTSCARSAKTWIWHSHAESGALVTELPDELAETSRPRLAGVARHRHHPSEPLDEQLDQEGREAAIVPPPERRNRRPLRVALALAGIGAFVWTLYSADLDGATALLAGLGPLALLALIPQALWTVVHAAGWRRLLLSLGHRPKLSDTTTVFFGTEAVLFSLPGGAAIAESLSVFLLRGRLGIPVADGLSSIANKKALVVLTNALYVALAVILAHAAITGASERLVGNATLVWALVGSALFLAALAAGMLASLSSGSLAAKVRGWLRVVPLRRLQSWLDERAVAMRHADDRLAAPSRDRRAMIVAGAWFMAHWLLETTETFLLLRLLGAPVSVTDALAIEVMGSLVRSAAVMMPAGIGVQDASYVAMLGAFGLGGAPALGAAFVLLKRAKEVLWIAVGYGVLATWRKKPRAAAPTSSPESPATA